MVAIVVIIMQNDDGIRFIFDQRPYLSRIPHRLCAAAQINGRVRERKFGTGRLPRFRDVHRIRLRQSRNIRFAFQNKCIRLFVFNDVACPFGIGKVA